MYDLTICLKKAMGKMPPSLSSRLKLAVKCEMQNAFVTVLLTWVYVFNEMEQSCLVG